MSFLPAGYISPEDDKDYLGIRTHSRYAVNIQTLLNQNSLSFNLKRPLNYIGLADEEKIIKRLSIVKYTLDSIQTEYEFSSQDAEFMPLALSWLWIKGYYGMFHLMSLLISLIKTDSKYMLDREYNDHSKIISIVNENLISNGGFSVNSLNTTFTGSELCDYKNTEHSNIKRIIQFDDCLFKLTLKKVYKKESSLKLKRLRGAYRLKIADKVDNKQYSIFDIFHYYRERFNYLGFHYLDSDNKPFNRLELNSFYNASYFIIISLVGAVNDYLISQTSGNLNTKLMEINLMKS